MRTLVINQFLDTRVIATDCAAFSNRLVQVGFACDCGDPEKGDHVGAVIPHRVVLN